MLLADLVLSVSRSLNLELCLGCGAECDWLCCLVMYFVVLCSLVVSCLLFGCVVKSRYGLSSLVLSRLVLCCLVLL